MKKRKDKYKVYIQFYCRSEDGYADRTEEWKLGGETWAVSHKQAINNIRNRLFGNDYSSQYKPQYSSGYCIEGYNYKAINTWTNEVQYVGIR